MRLSKIFNGKIPLAGLLGMVIFIGLFISSCDHPIQPSPQPGVLKVTMQHNPQDTVKELGGGSNNRLSNDDFFLLTISEGRVVREEDSAEAVLFPDLQAFRQTDVLVDILSLDQDGSPTTFQIFESKLPPGSYTELTFGVNVDNVVLELEGGQTFDQSVTLSPEVSLPLHLDADFSIREQQTTTIRLQLSSFESLTRYRDSFRFIPHFEVSRIQEP